MCYSQLFRTFAVSKKISLLYWFEMKRCLVALFGIALLLMGCKNDKVDIVKVNADADSTLTAQTQPQETVEEEDLLASQPMPSSAEKLFDDFIFNFASNKHLQMERIAFPLKVNSGYKVEEIKKEDWQMERFFMDDGAYTILFDNDEQKERMTDTQVSEVIVERIYLDRDFIRQYLFSRQNGRWMLSEIRNQTLPRNPNASFIKFYQRFVTDSSFQRASLSNEIDYVGPDPDDDVEPLDGDYLDVAMDDEEDGSDSLVGFISPDLWADFAPELPQTILYNIVYGYSETDSTKKILMLRGVANGLEEELTFERKGQSWKLTKLSR